jgi:hypothetical protein
MKYLKYSRIYSFRREGLGQYRIKRSSNET